MTCQHHPHPQGRADGSFTNRWDQNPTCLASKTAWYALWWLCYKLGIWLCSTILLLYGWTGIFSGCFFFRFGLEQHRGLKGLDLRIINDALRSKKKIHSLRKQTSLSFCGVFVSNREGRENREMYSTWHLAHLKPVFPHFTTSSGHVTYVER